MPNQKQALKFLKEIGLDEVIRETSQDCLVASEDPEIRNIAAQHDNINENKRVEIIAPKKSPTPNNFSLEGMRQAELESRKLADSTKSLEDLKATVLAFSGCDLKKTCMNTVFSDGNPKCEVMIVGEAPGANEDEDGIPFCGISGKFMDSYMKIIGLTREKNLYISNAVFWRPPGNRKPTEMEINICRPFVQKHIALIKPKIIIAVGSSSLQSLLPDVKKTISQIRGNVLDYDNPYLDEPIKVFPTFHPSYLLRQPLKKKLVWDDLLSMKKILAE